MQLPFQLTNLRAEWIGKANNINLIEIVARGKRKLRYILIYWSDAIWVSLQTVAAYIDKKHVRKVS